MTNRITEVLDEVNRVWMFDRIYTCRTLCRQRVRNLRRTGAKVRSRDHLHQGLPDMLVILLDKLAANRRDWRGVVRRWWIARANGTTGYLPIVTDEHERKALFRLLDTHGSKWLSSYHPIQKP